MKVYVLLDSFQWGADYWTDIVGVFPDFSTAEKSMKQACNQLIRNSYDHAPYLKDEAPNAIRIRSTVDKKQNDLRITCKAVQYLTDGGAFLNWFLEVCYPDYYSSSYIACINDCYKELDGEQDTPKYASTEECMNELERVTRIAVAHALDNYFYRLRREEHGLR